MKRRGFLGRTVGAVAGLVLGQRATRVGSMVDHFQFDDRRLAEGIAKSESALRGTITMKEMRAIELKLRLAYRDRTIQITTEMARRLKELGT